MVRGPPGGDVDIHWGGGGGGGGELAGDDTALDDHVVENADVCQILFVLVHSSHHMFILLLSPIFALKTP